MSDPADTPRRRRTLRERERDLELRASLIDTETTITYKQSARIILRAASYLRYFVGRSIIKLVLTWIGRALPIFVADVVRQDPDRSRRTWRAHRGSRAVPGLHDPRAEHAARLLGLRDHDLPRHRRCRPHASHGCLPRLPRQRGVRLAGRPGLTRRASRTPCTAATAASAASTGTRSSR